MLSADLLAQRALHQISRRYHRHDIISCAFGSARGSVGIVEQKALPPRLHQQQNAERSRLRECSATINRLGSRHAWLDAVQVFTKAQDSGLRLDAVCHVALSSACEKASQWESALRLAAQVLHDKHLSDSRSAAAACSLAIAAWGRGQHWSYALSLLEHSQDSFGGRTWMRDVVIWNAAIGACGRARRWLRVLSLLASMHTSGPAPTSVTYGTAMSACEKGSAWSLACQLLDDMIHAHVTPSIICYNSAICAYDRGQLWEAALGLLGVMRQQELQLSAVSYNACITACVNSSAWEGGLALLSVMQFSRVNPTQITFNAAIAACDRGGLWGFAFALLDKMRGKAIKADTTGYNTAISSCRLSSHWQHALLALERMVQQGPTPDSISFNAVIDVCKQQSLWSWSLHLLDVAGNQADIVTFNTVAAACVNSGEVQKALMLLEACVQASLQPSTEIYNTSISACNNSSLWMEAVQLLAEADSREIANTIGLNLAISACEKASQWVASLHMLESQSPIRKDIVTYNCAMSACEQGAEWRRVIALFESIACHSSKATFHDAVEPNAVSYKILLRAACHGPLLAGVAAFREAADLGHVQFWRDGQIGAIVDLHGLSVEGSRFASIAALLDAAILGDMQELIFITGQGLHSESGVCVIRNELFTLLQDDLHLSVMPHLQNPGRISVSLAKLRQP